jgi:signal transduction histidine kinase
MLVVPLKASDKILGVISADQDEWNWFDENDLHLVEALAAQAAIAYENAELLHRLERRAWQLDAINQVSAAMRTEDDLETVLRLALTCATADRGLGFSRVMLFLTSEDGRRLQGEVAVGALTEAEAYENWQNSKGFELQDYFQAARDWPKGPNGQLDPLVRRVSIPLDDEANPLARCLSSSETALQSATETASSTLPFDLAAFALVPLIARERPICVMLADNQFLSTPIQAEDVRMLETLAVQTANAIENARLVAQLERSFGEIAHQLRSPLMDMRGFIQMLADGLEKRPERIQDYYAFVLAAMEDFDSMVTDVLNLDKIEAGALRFQRQETSLKQIVQKVIRVHYYRAWRKHISLVEEYQHCRDQIFADPDRLASAIQVLVENAINYSYRGGRVTICTTDVGSGSAQIRVTDEGRGIPEEEIPRLFDKYFRGRFALEEHIDGNGIGLTIARYIVEVHGGSIKVQSTVGKGSAFTIRLPYE